MLGRRWLQLLGQMSTAVTLLAVVAAASVVGTVLLQQQPVAHYQQTFGPFWTQVFQHFSLTAVYHAWWYLALLLVVLVAVVVCLSTNGRVYWRQLQQPPMLPLPGVLARWPLQQVYSARAGARLRQRLAHAGWQWHPGPGGSWVAVCGGYRRWGYFAAHISVVLLTIGGLLTGCVGFRGIVHLPQGAGLDAVWLPQGDGGQAKVLPFTLTNQGFQLTAHADGTPADFVTEVVLQPKDGSAALRQFMRVNTPLGWGAYQVYQSSYGDAGSPVTLHWQPLVGAGQKVQTQVHQTAQVGATTIQVLDAHAHESRPRFDPISGARLGWHDVGPAVDVQLTHPAHPGQVVRLYQRTPDVVGVATRQRADGSYAFVPVALGVSPTDAAAWAVVQHLVQLPADTSAQAALASLPPALLTPWPPRARAAVVLQAWQAAAVLKTLDWPGVPVLQAWDPRYYTALQVAYDPGFWWFISGSILLILGVGLMVYVDQRRLCWVPHGQGWHLYGDALRDPEALEEHIRALSR